MEPFATQITYVETNFVCKCVTYISIVIMLLERHWDIFAQTSAD